jgi:hypothetical protein
MAAIKVQELIRSLEAKTFLASSIMMMRPALPYVLTIILNRTKLLAGIK